MSNVRADGRILIFDDVEVLDFAGPFEVFSRTRTRGRRRFAPHRRQRAVRDASPSRALATRSRAIGGLEGDRRTTAWTDAPPIDILVVPGGFGTRALLHDEATLDVDPRRGRPLRVR